MRRGALFILVFLIAVGALSVRALPQLAQTTTSSSPNPPTGTPPPITPPPATAPSGTPPGGTPPAPQQQNPQQQNLAQHTLAFAVVDPAHGGADTGARGASGIIESDTVLGFARLLRIALEAQGMHVILTRQGNEDPSFDQRSEMVNGQRGAIFITLHVSSTGPANTVRVYSLGQEIAPGAPVTGGRPQLVPWNNAQQSYADTSQKLAALVQTELAQRFAGSPDMPLTAAVRQLRTVAAPAIAVEVSSVSVPDKTSLDKMAPLLADGIAKGVVEFRPVYELGAN